MNRLGRVFKLALLLCLVTLGVFGASSAQAAWWMVSGANIAANKAALGALTTVGVLHTKIGGNEVLWECPKAQLINAFLEPQEKVGGGAAAVFHVKFEECITKINGTTNAACEPNDGALNPGVILTNQLLGLLILHELVDHTRDGLVLFVSDVKEVVGGVAGTPVFARIKMGAACPIGTNIPIIGGEFFAKDVGGNASLEEEKLTHEFEEGPLTELWALSKTAEHKAILLGKMKVWLVADEKWSGLPE